MLLNTVLWAIKIEENELVAQQTFATHLMRWGEFTQACAKCVG